MVPAVRKQTANVVATYDLWTPCHLILYSVGYDEGKYYGSVLIWWQKPCLTPCQQYRLNCPVIICCVVHLKTLWFSLGDESFVSMFGGYSAVNAPLGGGFQGINPAEYLMNWRQSGEVMTDIDLNNDDYHDVEENWWRWKWLVIWSWLQGKFFSRRRRQWRQEVLLWYMKGESILHMIYSKELDTHLYKWITYYDMERIYYTNEIFSLNSSRQFFPLL